MAGWTGDPSRAQTLFTSGTNIVMHKDQETSTGFPDAMMAVV
jgi:hypothetical protein